MGKIGQIFPIHVAIIMLLLIMQFFMTDLFAVMFLPVVEKNIRQSENNGKFYYSSAYKSSSDKAPNEYAFVFVREIGQKKVETYYSLKGNRVSVTYINGQWNSTQSVDFANIAYLVLPFIGFITILFALLHKMFRTGTVTTWKLNKFSFDKIESLSLLYGISLFLSAIIFAWAGRI